MSYQTYSQKEKEIQARVQNQSPSLSHIFPNILWTLLERVIKKMRKAICNPTVT